MLSLLSSSAGNRVALALTAACWTPARVPLRPAPSWPCSVDGGSTRFRSIISSASRNGPASITLSAPSGAARSSSLGGLHHHIYTSHQASGSAAGNGTIYLAVSGKNAPARAAAVAFFGWVVESREAPVNKNAPAGGAYAGKPIQVHPGRSLRSVALRGHLSTYYDLRANHRSKTNTRKLGTSVIDLSLWTNVPIRWTFSWAVGRISAPVRELTDGHT